MCSSQVFEKIIKSSRCPECSFTFIWWVHFHLIISFYQIQGCKNLCTIKTVREFLYSFHFWSINFSYCIYPTVINTYSICAIRFGYYKWVTDVSTSSRIIHAAGAFQWISLQVNSMLLDGTTTCAFRVHYETVKRF